MIKLSQRDEEIKLEVGDRLKFIGKKDDSHYHNGDICEIMKITGNPTFGFRYLVKNLREGFEYEFGYSTLFNYGYFQKVEKTEKMHEFSPVKMTGRYRTIGD